MRASGHYPRTVSFTPLETGRLVIRAAGPEDLDGLSARRNDPEVARYQSWEVPFARDEAATLLQGSAAQGGLKPGEWWMTTITDADAGTPVGDLSVHLDAGGRMAEIGYSLDRAAWGNGYATEAVAAMLDHLFHDVGLARVSASVHPDNVASAMVLERTGFLYEGRTRLSDWDGNGDEAGLADALLYGLTMDDHVAWQDRPRGRPGRVELVEIDDGNQRQVRALVTHKSQERLVAPVVASFADALYPPIEDGERIVPRARAITADGELAGFVMTAEPTEGNPDPYLWRLLVDRRHQRRGIGAMALDVLEAEYRAAGRAALFVSYGQDRGSPEPFYLGRGYVPTGEVVDGEIEAKLDLGRSG